MELLAALLALVLMLVAVAGPLTIRERDDAAQERRDRIEPLRLSVLELQLAAADERVAVQDYLIAADESHVDTFQTAADHARLVLGELSSLTSQTPHAPAVQRVQRALQRWEQEIAEPTIEFVRTGRRDEAIALKEGGEAAGLFGNVESEIRNLRTNLLADVAEADERIAAAGTRLTVLLWTLMIGGVAFTGVMAVLVRRWVTDPLDSIVADLQAVRGGDRHRTIRQVGPPDLADLAANIEAMRSETVSRLDEAIRANEALEQQGPAVVTLRSELAPSGPWPDYAEIAAVLQPAQGVLAGDWYDVVDRGNGCFVVVVVDVSGHGPGAGVFALRVKHLLLAALTDGLDPGDAFGWLAARIGETGERFLTGFVAEVDVTAGQLRYANAGHPPAVVTDADGGFGETSMLAPTGPLIGPLPGSWATVTVGFPESARLVVYTDGLVEARDGYGRSFGEEGLRAVLADVWGRPEAIANACLDAIRTFSGGRAEDDVTVVAVQAGGLPSARASATRAPASTLDPIR